MPDEPVAGRTSFKVSSFVMLPSNRDVPTGPAIAYLFGIGPIGFNYCRKAARAMLDCKD